MEYLERNTDIRWAEGQKPTCYIPSCFPHTSIYICCGESRYGGKEIYYRTKYQYERRNPEEMEIEVEN